MSARGLCCTQCDPPRTFISTEQERRHELEYHADSFTVSITTKAGLLEKVVVEQVDGVFKCPICRKSLTTKTGCRKHLKNNLCTEKDNNKDPPEPALPAVTLPKHQIVPPPPAPHQPSKTRGFDDAVLYSCGELHALAGEKRKTLGIVESLELKPISIKDALGIEQNALAHATVILRLPAGPVELSPVEPQKRRKLDEDETCSNCSPAPAPGLEHLLSSSPYAARLATRNYVELSDEICELLNRDWQFSPHLRYASAVILAGCLLINKKNGQAVIANTVEPYGRQKTVDIHREPFIVQKGQPATTSLPPSIKTPYKKVWPVTVPTIDGKRLIIGTKSFDALITSSLRLDKVAEPSIGASTPSYVLTDISQSLATTIFLDAEYLDIGLRMAKNKDAWSVSSSDLLHQLRQVKTKFFDASTFYLCRASSFFADNHTCQPYTIFNLASFDQAHSGDGVAASNLFHTIACDVIRDGSHAILKKERVRQLRGQCTEQGSISIEFDGIMNLYGDESSVSILDNRDLNAFLENLASHLSPYVSKANKAVASFLAKEFE
ncbi:hypothetical protein BGZ96_004743 [Linnemannia gamsii]|uniref:C2H2-type domain-containing protein n=1 Tax=Linnemannia gamsii TaxID=64522 RepID=A0ABQ7KFN0_9FUNG|nr:hypothetical protein BGZ96_004743 [Linnemannia gamsii]